jgi:TolA-binding protein
MKAKFSAADKMILPGYLKLKPEKFELADVSIHNADMSQCYPITVLVLLLFIASACNTATNAKFLGATSLEKTPTPTPTPKKSPGKSAGDYEQALKDYRDKNFDKAAQGFKEVIASDPKHTDAHFYLGSIYFDKQEYETSLPHFEQALKFDNKSVKKMLALGENQRVLKKFDVAVVQFQKSIGFEPKNPNGYFGLGQTYVGLNNKIAARQQLQKLAELDQEMADKLKKQIDAMK